MSMGVFDMLAIGGIAISAFLAFRRGFVHEVLAIAAWVGAIVAAVYGFSTVQPLTRRWIDVDWIADAVAAALIFLVSLIVLSVVVDSLAKNVQKSRLSALDRSLGALFGLLRGVVLLSFAFMVLTFVFPRPGDRPSWIMASRSAPWLQLGADLLRAAMPGTVFGYETRLKDDARAAEAPRSPPVSTRREESKSTPEGYDDRQRQDLDRLFETSR